MGKFTTMLTDGRSDQSSSNILDRIDDSYANDSESFLSVAAKLGMLGLIWFVGIKIPQNSETPLTICGSFLSMLLLVLFPILIFNKVYKHTKSQGIQAVRWVNWILFFGSIAAGSVGLYNGISQMIKKRDDEVLILVQND